jgi:hypothetical protein
MQIVTGPSLPQPTSSATPAVAPVTGPAAPAAPLEPERRVTANREGRHGDLAPQQQPQRSQHLPARGRLIDLFV